MLLLIDSKKVAIRTLIRLIFYIYFYILVPRAVINPRCGSSFSTSERSNLELTQYVEPTGINYYKISPNYFYQAGYLKIRPQSSGTIIVCTSRTDPNIRQNTTGADCQTTSSNEVSKDISTYCTDSSVSNCSPIYVSVEATTATQARCTGWYYIIR